MKPSSTFLRIGITGGIGSGKSTVCKLFASLGRQVISADDIARTLTDSSSEIQSDIRKTFGETVFLPNGRVNRSALAEIVFQNPSHRKTLDAIIHPHVFAAIDHSIQEIPPAARSPFVVVEAALIYETGMDERLDYVVVVTADEDSRIQRVMARDNLSRDAVLARMFSQMNPLEKAKLADFVIENDGSLEGLPSRVKFIDTVLTLMKRDNLAAFTNG